MDSSRRGLVVQPRLHRDGTVRLSGSSNKEEEVSTQVADTVAAVGGRPKHGASRKYGILALAESTGGSVTAGPLDRGDYTEDTAIIKM